MATSASRRRQAIAGAVLCAALAALAGGCHVTGHKAPTGLLGLHWGDDAADGGRGLGLACNRWDPWIDPAFETSLDFDHPVAVLGAEGLARLVRSGGRELDGVQVIYRACAGDEPRKQALRAARHSELHVKATDVDVPYEIWHDNSLVHFIADPSDGTCTLTVAGPRFGKAFEAALLRGGLGNVGAAVPPK